ncbi:MAG: hypothetical protein AAF799_13545 [Myxococcota bacterium]
MTRIATLASLTVTLALPGCVIDHQLGETAADGSTGGTTGGSTGDGAMEDGSSADPSATSGQLPTVSSSVTASGDDSGSSITATSDDGGIPTETATDTEGEPNCEEDPRYIAWNQDSFDALPGIEASFAAALSGDCQLTNATQDPGEGHLWAMELDCLLSGHLDGDDSIVDQDFTISLDGSSSDPWMSWIDEVDAENLELRVVLDWWGMGWNRYLVLSDSSGVLLDLVAAEYVNPTQEGSLVDQAEELVNGQAWHGALDVDIVDSDCTPGGTFCNDEPSAVVFESLDGGDAVQLEPNQSTEIATTDPDRVYQAAVVTAFQIPPPGCPDTPNGSYDFALWALEL